MTLIHRFAFVALLTLSSQLCFANDWVTLHTIVDGDTIKVKHQNKLVTVRLLGIDTAETSTNTHLQWQRTYWKKTSSELIQWGKKAKNFLQQRLTTGDPLRLEYDTQRIDYYNRTLAYVYLADGTMINALLLEYQLAHIFVIPPNLRHQDLLAKLWMTN